MAQYLEYEAERRKSGDAAFPQIQTQSKNFSKLRRRDTLNMKRYDLKEGERRNNNSGSANFTQMPLGFFDPVRSASMIGWSTLAVTPLFMQLFRFMETYLPKGKTGSLPARVLLTTSCAFPMNVLFFTYATCTHYLIEELYVSSPSMLDWEKILRNMKNETRLKLQQEYWSTTQNSVMYWSPLNAINHAFVPPHMKTVFLNGFQMFWNCYLSLAQHREIELESDSKKCTSSHINQDNESSRKTPKKALLQGKLTVETSRLSDSDIGSSGQTV